MSHGTHLYFDHPYEPDPEERGLYWATRFTDSVKIFGFLPDNLYENIDVTRMGVPLEKADVCGVNNEKCPVLEIPENIVGEYMYVIQSIFSASI
jgi:hexosaminidase